VPAPENCVSPADEDCDGLTPSCTGTIEFAAAAGNHGAQSPNGLAVTPAGELALVGAALGGIDFGPPTAATGAAWTHDMFAAYFEPSGTPRWAVLYGDGQSQELVGAEFDAAGDLIVTGDLMGTVDFGQGPLSSANPAGVLARLTDSGEVEWAKLLSGSRSVVGTDVAISPQGNIVGLGWFSGTLDLGGGPMTSDLGYLFSSYVALFDAQGNWIWDQGIHGEQTLATGVAVDGTGAVLVGGWFVRAFDLGEGPITGAGNVNGFIARYSPSGKLEMSRVFDGYGAGASVAAIATNDTGDFVVAGGFDKELEVGAGLMQGSYAAFVAKLDSSGKALWSKSFDSSGQMSAYDVAVDPWGNVLVCGHLSGTISSPISISSPTNGAFVIKLDPDGNVVWAQAFQGTSEHQATLIGTDAAGTVYVAGHFSGEVTLGDDVFVSTGQSDIYVVRLSP
jgi:hypothetical protein